MNPIVGLGAPLVAATWAVSLLFTVWWLGRQVRRGSTVTVSTYVVFFWFFFPILLQYPFTFSPLNAVFATGPAAFDAYVRVVDTAFLASLLGMAGFSIAYRATSGRARPYLPSTVVTYGLRGWSNTTAIWGSGLAVILLFIPFAFLDLAAGEGVRNAVLQAPALRPLFSAVATVLPLLIALTVLYALESRSRGLWILIVVLLLLSFSSGTRGVAFGGLLLLVLSLAAHASFRGSVGRREVLAALPYGLLALLLVLYLGDVRAGQYNLLATLARTGGLLFYGSNFSDLRDFAWVMAYWDGDYFLGRTQLAGYTGIIPSMLWDFRVEWGWGRVSTDITGIAFREVDSAHAGLRPGIFGEAFFNFAWPGVLVAGLLLGYVTRRIDAAARHAVALEERAGQFGTRLQMLAAFVTIGLWFHVFLTAGFFAVYVTLGALLLLRIAHLLLTLTLRATAAAPGTAAPPAAAPRS